MNVETTETERLSRQPAPAQASVRRDLTYAFLVFAAVAGSAVALSLSIKTALLLAALSGATTLIVCAMAQESAMAIRSRKWPATIGTVLTSEVRPRLGNNYSADLEIAYQVNGVDYSCSRIQFGPQPSNRSGVEKLLREYTKGTEVSISYDPVNPARSICRAGFNPSFLFYLAGIALCAYAGAVILKQSIPSKPTRLQRTEIVR